MKPNLASRRAALAPHGLAANTPLPVACSRHVDMKKCQSEKIRDISEALVVSGLVTLDQQAPALGLSRSTAWTVLRGKHKASGLSASVISQMLNAPRLPLLVRGKIFEYIEEKIAGSYGHCPKQVRRFLSRLAAKRGHRIYEPTSTDNAGPVRASVLKLSRQKHRS